MKIKVLWDGNKATAPQILKALGDFGVPVNRYSIDNGILLLHRTPETVIAIKAGHTVEVTVPDKNKSGHTLTEAQTQEARQLLTAIEGAVIGRDRGDGVLIPTGTQIPALQLIDFLRAITEGRS